MDVRRVYSATQVAASGASRVRSERPTAPLTRRVRDPKVVISISRQADLMSRLSSLKQQQPAQFEELMDSLGRNLKAAANPQSGVVGSELGALGDRLLRVAQTGELGLFSGDPGHAAGGVGARAVSAYLRNRPDDLPSPTVDQALEYVRTAAEPLIA